MAKITKVRKLRVDPIPSQATVLQWLELSVEELTQIIRENPSLRGMIVGYVAEFQLRKIFAADPRVSQLMKDDDHDRTSKGDLRFIYKEQTFRVEAKSLQTNLVKAAVNGVQICTFQCDASDARPVIFSDKSKVSTTNLLVGEFDMLAVNMFAVANRWTFGFAKNGELPRSTKLQFTELQRSELLATNMKITWPLSGIYNPEPFVVLDALVEERRQQLHQPSD
jgi:hypothetical protein